MSFHGASGGRGEVSYAARLSEKYGRELILLLLLSNCYEDLETTR